MYDFPKILTQNAIEAMNRSDDKRIIFIKSKKYIRYQKEIIIDDKLEDLLLEPKKPRMPCLLIIGSSNNGKTSLVKRFFEKYPPTDGIDAEAFPVVYVVSPAKSDFGYLYDKIFEALSIPFRKSDPLSQKESDIKFYFKKAGTKVLIIDEIHNILGGTAGKQREYMNAIKNLNNELEIPIVLVGTKDALNVTNTDTQISSRFRPMVLPLWSLDDEFDALIYGLERSLPLKKPSKLLENDKLLEKILELSEGLIGEVVEIISSAAINAIRSGSEKISMKEIKDLHYVPLSQRRNIDQMNI